MDDLKPSGGTGRRRRHAVRPVLVSVAATAAVSAAVLAAAHSPHVASGIGAGVAVAAMLKPIVAWSWRRLH